MSYFNKISIQEIISLFTFFILQKFCKLPPILALLAVHFSWHLSACKQADEAMAHAVKFNPFFADVNYNVSLKEEKSWVAVKRKRCRVQVKMKKRPRGRKLGKELQSTGCRWIPSSDDAPQQNKWFSSGRNHHRGLGHNAIPRQRRKTAFPAHLLGQVWGWEDRLQVLQAQRLQQDDQERQQVCQMKGEKS